MYTMTYPAKFRYPVYQPASQSIDVTADWGQGRFETTNDPALALSQPWSVAAVRVLCNEPGVFDYDPALADMDLSQFDLVLLSDIEYYSVKEIRAWIGKNKIQRYVLALGGLVQGEELDQSCMVYRPWWAYNLLRHNEYQDTYQDQKPYMFEALLGARRPHRDYVMMAMDKTALLDRSIVTYRDCFEGKLIDRNCDQFQQTFYDTPLKWPYVSANLDPAWEVTHNITRSISPYVPWNIYQRSHYSIVCETLGTGTTFFWSEKVTKCLLARRIFVFFGAQGFLARMRELGFETFGSILDESYDEHPVDSIRFERAMHQVLQLAYFENPKVLYERIQTILDHNQSRLRSYQIQFQATMSDLLHQHIEGGHWLWDDEVG